MLGREREKREKKEADQSELMASVSAWPGQLEEGSIPPPSTHSSIPSLSLSRSHLHHNRRGIAPPILPLPLSHTSLHMVQRTTTTTTTTPVFSSSSSLHG